MKLLVTIIPRELSQKVAKTIGKNLIVDYQTTLMGAGTAPNAMLEYLSLGKTDKDIILNLIDDSDLPAIFKRLDDQFDFTHGHKGVAFAVELNSISKYAYQLLHHELKEEKNHGNQ